MEQNFLEDMANMIVSDYIIANTDRHKGNIHFYVDNKTNEVISMTPLFDHNQSLIADMFNTDIKPLIYELTNKSMEETMEEYSEHSTIKTDAKLDGKVAERYDEALERTRRDYL